MEALHSPLTVLVMTVARLAVPALILLAIAALNDRFSHRHH